MDANAARSSRNPHRPITNAPIEQPEETNHQQQPTPQNPTIRTTTTNRGRNPGVLTERLNRLLARHRTAYVEEARRQEGDAEGNGGEGAIVEEHGDDLIEAVEIDDLMEANPPLFLMSERQSEAEKFCKCLSMDACKCGENTEEGFDWCFDEASMTTACEIAKHGTEVVFHPRFSIGTSCVRADRPLRHGQQHYFEVKVLTSCFGTDMMVGIGTEKADMKKYQHRFVSLLGCDQESWGLSYKGSLYHNGEWTEYHGGFGQGMIVGVHVDMWRGRVSYHINRKSIGVAFTINPSTSYYPMISSTAAKSRFRLITARSYATNLQYMCCDAIRQAVPHGERYLPSVMLPPALKLYLENNLIWLMRGTDRSTSGLEQRSDQGGRKRNSDGADRSDRLSTCDGPSTSSSSRGASAIMEHAAALHRSYRERMNRYTHRLGLIPIIALDLEDDDQQQQQQETTDGNEEDLDAGPVVKKSKQ